MRPRMSGGMAGARRYVRAPMPIARHGSSKRSLGTKRTTEPWGEVLGPIELLRAGKAVNQSLKRLRISLALCKYSCLWHQQHTCRSLAVTATTYTGRPMMLSRLAVALTLSIVCTNITTAGNFRFQATARNPGVKYWISYEIVGPRNHPFPIVYLSTQHFRAIPPELIVVLPKRRYDIVSAYTQARIARPDCPGEMPTDEKQYTFGIVEGAEERTQSCVLPQASACDYLSGVVKLSGVNWTTEELRPIKDFMLTMRCDTLSAE